MTDKPLPAMREFMVVDDPDTMKLLLSGKYDNIIELIDYKEMAISDIARVLKINPGSVHYHLKALEKRGLVILVREEKKGNIVKKYYRTSARTFYIDGCRYRMLRPGEKDPMDEFYDKLLRAMAPLGYEIPPDKTDRLKEIMRRYNLRGREILRELQGAGVEDIETDRMVVSDAYDVALRFRKIQDREMRELREELRIFLEGIGDHQ
jgi:DNA-binding transcriptional ArsR family regulator